MTSVLDLFELYIESTKLGKSQWDLLQEPSSQWDDYCYKTESITPDHPVILKKNSDIGDYKLSLRSTVGPDRNFNISKVSALGKKAALLWDLIEKQ